MGANPILEPNKLTGSAIIFFDSNCLLCSRFIKILLKNDKQKFYYSGFDSQIAKDILSENLRCEPQTVVLYHDGKILSKSTAIFKIVRYLRFPWPILTIFGISPTSLNDLIYDWISRNRISWFGRSETCFLPTPEQKIRFFE